MIDMIFKALFCLFPMLLGCLALFFSSCSENDMIRHEMDLAENIMETKPDSALCILSGISSSSLPGKKESARYALLMSTALDKNFIDTTDFKVLQPAIDYFLKKGTPDERLRTYYYQGRILQNQGKKDVAMLSFISAIECEGISDSLTLARSLVARGTLEYSCYKINDFVKDNLTAAAIYNNLGKSRQKETCLIRALNGSCLLNDSTLAYNIMGMLRQEISDENNSTTILPALLSFAITFKNKDNITEMIKTAVNLPDLSVETRLDITRGYLTVENPEKAYEYLSDISIPTDTTSLLKYLAVKTDVLEANKKYKEALDSYRHFSAVQSEVIINLSNQDLYFAQARHDLDRQLMEKESKNKLIEHTCFALATILGIIILWIINMVRMMKAKRKLVENERDKLKLLNDLKEEKCKQLETEKKNIQLELKQKELEEAEQKLRQDNILKEKKNLELENKNAELLLKEKNLEIENLKLMNINLKTENDNICLEKRNTQLELEKQTLVSENLNLKIYQLESECENLNKIMKSGTIIPTPITNIIKDRLDALNGILASKISNDAKYTKKYAGLIDGMIKNKEQFLQNTRLAFKGSHPQFISTLEKYHMTSQEIDYLCLLAIGLRGKEAGDYINIKRHYHISSDIRQKLGLRERDTNLSIYVGQLLNGDLLKWVDSSEMLNV